MDECLELAWAAGFFDGEGWVYQAHKEGKRRKDGTQRAYPKLGLGNTDLPLLERFQKALGCGKVYGPYREKKPHVKPFWQWSASHKQGRQAARLLLPYVGDRNIKRLMEAYSEDISIRGDKRRQRH